MSLENDAAIERATRTAEAVRRAVDAVADLRTTARDPDELIEVVADATPALARVALDPRVFRRPVDQVCILLANVIDEAVTGARQSRREALLAALPAGLRALADGSGPPSAPVLPGTSTTRPGASLPASDILGRATAEVRDRVGALEAGVRELAEEEFEGAAGDGQVVVTVTGQTRVRRITLGRSLLQNLDSTAVAEHLVTATNAALAAVAARLAELAGTGPAAGTSASLQAFNRRMDDLLARLDTLDRALDLS